MYNVYICSSRTFLTPEEMAASKPRVHSIFLRNHLVRFISFVPVRMQHYSASAIYTLPPFIYVCSIYVYVYVYIIALKLYVYTEKPFVELSNAHSFFLKCE